MSHFYLFPTELWLSLEEHQYALELIMGRYRKQMLQLMMGKKKLDTKPVLSLHEDHAKVYIHSFMLLVNMFSYFIIYSIIIQYVHIQLFHLS